MKPPMAFFSRKEGVQAHLPLNLLLSSRTSALQVDLGQTVYNKMVNVRPMSKYETSIDTFLFLGKKGFHYVFLLLCFHTTEQQRYDQVQDRPFTRELRI